MIHFKNRKKYLTLFAMIFLIGLTTLLYTRNKTALHTKSDTSVSTESSQRLIAGKKVIELGDENIVKPTIAEKRYSQGDSSKPKRTEGIFVFNNIDLKSILTELSIWYNVPVIYKGPISKHTYFGTFSKSEKLEEILSFIQDQTKVQISIENKQIIVRP